MVIRCCVEGCKNSSKDKILHSFPKDLEKRKEWIYAIKRMDLLQKDMETVRKYYRVCDVHFSDAAKYETHHNRTNLKVNSVPTLHVPEATVHDSADPVTMPFEYVSCNPMMENIIKLETDASTEEQTNPLPGTSEVQGDHPKLPELENPSKKRKIDARRFQIVDPLHSPDGGYS